MYWVEENEKYLSIFSFNSSVVLTYTRMECNKTPLYFLSWCVPYLEQTGGGGEWYNFGKLFNFTLLSAKIANWHNSKSLLQYLVIYSKMCQKPNLREIWQILYFYKALDPANLNFQKYLKNV